MLTSILVFCVPLSQQNLVSIIVLQPLEIQRHGWYDPTADGFVFLVEIYF